MQKLTGIFLLILLAATLVAGCDVGEAKVATPAEQQAASPLPVEIASPQTADIFAMYQTTATVASDSEAPVIARAAGEVVEILVEEGDLVEAGQVLARLDGERLRLRMLQARADLDKTRKEYDRYVSLHQRGLVSSSAYEGLKFDMDSLQASYDLTRLNYNYTKIRAPISGVVSSREIKTGQHINEKDATFRITETSRLVAYLKIPQTELAKFAVGQQAEILVDAMPDQTFTATIARISPTVDARNGTFRATAYVDNTDSALAPGMFGRFSIAYEKHSDALVIPTSALLREDGENVVYVVKDGAAMRRTIEIGIESNGQIEVLRGLSEDEQIVVTGHGGLRDGSRVLASNNRPDTIIG